MMLGQSSEGCGVLARLFFWVTVLTCGSFKASAQNLDATLAILATLYSNTGGPSWTNNDNWLSTFVSVCEWYGITCEGDQVVAIELPNNNMIGNLPTTVFNLQSMASMDLSINGGLSIDLDGVNEAPALKTLVLDTTNIQSLQGISFATGLTELSLSNCLLSGAFPQEEFSAFSSTLEVLDISNNRFSNEFPTEISAFNKLRVCKASDNEFSGLIPTELAIRDIEEIDISRNMWSGPLPEDFGDLRKLISFACAGNPDGTGQLTGPLVAFDNVPDLTSLFLDYNNFQGPIPDNFLQRTDSAAAIEVSLTFNNLSGVIPVGLDRFDSLVIRLAGNQITGIPPELCSLGGWMNGLVAEFGCDAILCPQGTFNAVGSRTAALLCDPCPAGTQFLGTIECSNVPLPTLPPPTSMPSVSSMPSAPPMFVVTVPPSTMPSTSHTSSPSGAPTISPSLAPSGTPSISLSPTLSAQPSGSPSISQAPSVSAQPSTFPSYSPSDVPTRSLAPSDGPTMTPVAPSTSPSFSSMAPSMTSTLPDTPEPTSSASTTQQMVFGVLVSTVFSLAFAIGWT